eukprot:TRINITY_DN10828_c0_g1_i1.p1 TRINITY_DN10828_c0_g1~~TRINITY_DN10828_c0_g1_i1.p1  ORF type:complete len:111 (-),score=19.73 TRINITY_DN10828_c0_g1_i1:20-352(-)
MRDGRERLNVIHYHGSQTVDNSGTVSHQDVYGLDIWKTNQPTPLTELSQEEITYTGHKQKEIDNIANGTFRIFSCTKLACATGFAIHPEIIATNHHVWDEIKRPKFSNCE